MKPFLPICFFISALFFFPSFAHADEQVTVNQWTQQTLLDTLSVNYTEQADDFAQIRANYTFDAWNGIVNFLGGYMNVIRAKQLTLHPVPAGDAQIIKSGTVSGINYWRINQNITIPELGIELFFSVLILARDPSTGSPYIIQSMDIRKSP
ncbi:DotI/IcmL/TraM family protein [Legionella shakespearei]|uniref:DotI/IcmL/TraM family protein n=1 Tax=Legionella shakespearei TaxID=45075 RepID=UPI0003A42DE1|nr:DotI/IcmL/TraM family protein [Legionella shakespearei]